MRTSLSELRRSKTSRFISIILLVNFLTSQNLYAQEYHIQEGTHFYPVRDVIISNGVYTPVLDKGLLKVFVAETLQRCGVNATKSSFSGNFH